MDWQPDTDLLVDAQIAAQREEHDAVEETAPADQSEERSQSTSAKPPPAPRTPGTTTLEAFFRALGATLVASRPQSAGAGERDGNRRPDPQAARDNVKQALKDLRDLQAGAKTGPRHRYLHILAPVTLAALVLGAATLFPNSPQSLSSQLTGSWESTAAKYTGRTLRLSESEIAFGQGPGRGVVRYPITRVSWRRESDGALVYDVSYDNAGGVHRFSFVHQPVANTITLKNQPLVVWRKIDTQKLEPGN